MLSQWTNFSIQQISVQHLNIWEPTGGSDSKESACNARDLGSIPELGQIPWEGHSYPLQYSCLENSIDRGAWWASVHGSQRIRHDWVPNTFTKYLTNSCVRHWWQWAEHRVCPSGEAGTGRVVLVEVSVRAVRNECRREKSQDGFLEEVRSKPEPASGVCKFCFPIKLVMESS